jgi:hypothetical protein
MYKLTQPALAVAVAPLFVIPQGSASALAFAFCLFFHPAAKS